MKKLLALLLTLCLCFGLLAACGAPAEETPTEPAPTVPTAPTEPPMQTSDPAADDTLNILLIGHSFCYYFTDELYGMLTAAGIKARVSNLYDSGCLLETHHKRWKEDTANYPEFATVDENGRVSVTDVSLRQALAAQNWDIISLQPGIDFYNRTAAIMLEDTAVAREELIGFLKQQFPQSKFFWHQFWAFQTGFTIDKQHWRADPYDNQVGEMETADRGFSFSEYERSKEILSHEAITTYRRYSLAF